MNVQNFRVRKFPGSLFFGEIKVIEIERIFCPMTTAHNATATEFTTGAVRALSAKIRTGNGFTRISKIYSDCGFFERIPEFF